MCFIRHFPFIHLFNINGRSGNSINVTENKNPHWGQFFWTAIVFLGSEWEPTFIWTLFSHLYVWKPLSNFLHVIKRLPLCYWRLSYASILRYCNKTLQFPRYVNPLPFGLIKKIVTLGKVPAGEPQAWYAQEVAGCGLRSVGARRMIMWKTNNMVLLRKLCCYVSVAARRV